MSTTNNTIILKGDPARDEAIANAAITPGNLIELLSTGKVQKQATAAVPAQAMFAIEDEMQGNDLTDDYSAADLVQYAVFKKGQWVHAILADGEAAVIGSKLESNGSGELRVQDTNSDGTLTNPEAILGIAREAVDASDSATTAVASRRIMVEIV